MLPFARHLLGLQLPGQQLPHLLLLLLLLLLVVALASSRPPLDRHQASQRCE
jgi:hypothetical protein